MQNHVSTIRASIGLDPAYCFYPCWFPFPELEWCPCISELIAWWGRPGWWAGSAWKRLGLGSFPSTGVWGKSYHYPVLQPPLWRLTIIRTGPRRISDLHLAGERGAGEGSLPSVPKISVPRSGKGGTTWLFAVLQVIMVPFCRLLQERLIWSCPANLWAAIHILAQNVCLQT